MPKSAFLCSASCDFLVDGRLMPPRHPRHREWMICGFAMTFAAVTLPLLSVVRSCGGALRRSLSSCCLAKRGTKLNPSRTVSSAKKNPLPDAGIGKLFALQASWPRATMYHHHYCQGRETPVDFAIGQSHYHHLTPQVSASTNCSNLL